MSPDVVITGLGTISGLGVGIDANWEGFCSGRSAIERLADYSDPAWISQIAATVKNYDVRQFVPKSYRKHTKVMARDIELAVGAADSAIRNAGILTPGIEGATERTYPGPRTGAHIGAGLIAADLDELSSALTVATDANGDFDIHKWGTEGMESLTPLWLLKYLPNMLACHVTIIHDSQGPSNTITCAEASAGLSIGESVRVIQRGMADMCFCGGAESKVNPMSLYRQMVAGRLTGKGNDAPGQAIRPFDQNASGGAIGEGGGIITLETEQTARVRGARIYARIRGFGASHTVYPSAGGLAPDPEGRGFASAMRAALNDAKLTPDDIDLIIPYGSAIPSYDQAEAAAIKSVFGDRATKIELWSSKPFVGTCMAGAGGIDVAIAARMLLEQKIPARINCDDPIAGLNAANAPARDMKLNHVLVFSTGLGGQNVALILERFTN